LNQNENTQQRISAYTLYMQLLRYLAPYKAAFLFSLCCMIIYGATDGAVPFIIKYVLDKVFQAHSERYLYVFPVVLILLTAVRALADFGQQYLMAKIGHCVVRDIRNELNAKLLSLEPGFFVRHAGGDLISRVTNDVILVRSLLTESISSIIRDTIRIIVLLASAFYLDPVLAAIAFIALPAGVLPIQKFGKKIRRLSKKGQEDIGILSNMLQESIIGNKVVKIFGGVEYENTKFKLQNETLTRTFVKSEKVKAITGPVNEVLASLAVGGVIFYGGSSVIANTRTQGDFIAFLVAVFLLYDPFKKLSKLSSNVLQSLAGAQRIFEIFSLSPKVQEPVNPKQLPSHTTICFENVSFSYQNSHATFQTNEEENSYNGVGEKERLHAINSISLTIKKGEKTAFVGLSGSGKSTLMDLIPRFIDPTQGVITLGGINIKDFEISKLRSLIAMVSQHTFLFNDTVYQNIQYGNLYADSEMITEAAKRAFALDFIEKLPQGFATKIGEGGLTLSGGERQRIAIARAILKDAPILILDEATASLDNQSENVVQSAIEALQENRTTLIIAHRLSTVMNVDKTYVMKEGQIIEEGNHESLMEKRGEYYNLFSYQTKVNSHKYVHV
jgi:ATP-binding cassette, subfamily B, bacterial MsbA